MNKRYRWVSLFCEYDVVDAGDFLKDISPRVLHLLHERNIIADENAALVSFVDFYVSAEGLALAGEVGYVALTEREYELALQRFRNRTTGSILEGGASVGVTLEDLLHMQEDAAGADTTAAADTTAL